MPIEFWTCRSTAAFINPLKGWQLDEQSLEFRKDPLLGHVSLFSPAIQGKRDILFPAPDPAFVQSVADATRPSCFLCDGKWEKMTPKYPEDLIPGGRLRKGEVVLFPNLFPTSPYHAVIMLGNDHYRPLNDFPQDLLRDAFDVSIDFIRTIFEKDRQMAYATVNANYLPPAGSSVFHPHVQILIAPAPSTHHEKVLRASRRYYEENGRSYWMDLVETEQRKKDRYVVNLGSSHWIMAFSPMGTNEVLGIFPEKGNILTWTPDDTEALARGVSLTLKFYYQQGFSTYNFSLFGAPLGDNSLCYGAFVRLVCRQNFVPNYRTDDYYLQKLMENEIMATTPEELARSFREMLSTHDA